MTFTRSTDTVSNLLTFLTASIIAIIWALGNRSGSEQ